jgi:hypothetical protein
VAAVVAVRPHSIGRATDTNDLVNPVPAYWDCRVLPAGHTSQPPAPSLDHRYSPGVVVVAGQQHSIDSISPGDDQALPQDAGRISAPPIWREDRLTDVAASCFSRSFSWWADGGAANIDACDARQQERSRNLTLSQVQPAVVGGQSLTVGIPLDCGF